MNAIRNRQDLEEVNRRIEELVALGDKAGGVSMLSDDLQDEYVRLSDLVYDYETEEYDCSWRVKKSVLDEIRRTFREKGMRQKEAAKIIGMSPTGFSDLLNGRRSLSFEIAKNLYNKLGVSADVLFA